MKKGDLNIIKRIGKKRTEYPCFLSNILKFVQQHQQEQHFRHRRELLPNPATKEIEIY